MKCGKKKSRSVMSINATSAGAAGARKSKESSEVMEVVDCRYCGYYALIQLLNNHTKSSSCLSHSSIVVSRPQSYISEPVASSPQSCLHSSHDQLSNPPCNSKSCSIPHTSNTQSHRPRFLGRWLIATPLHPSLPDSSKELALPLLPTTSRTSL